MIEGMVDQCTSGQCHHICPGNETPRRVRGVLIAEGILLDHPEVGCKGTEFGDERKMTHQCNIFPDPFFHQYLRRVHLDGIPLIGGKEGVDSSHSDRGLKAVL